MKPLTASKQVVLEPRSTILVMLHIGEVGSEGIVRPLLSNKPIDDIVAAQRRGLKLLGFAWKQVEEGVVDVEIVDVLTTNGFEEAELIYTKTPRELHIETIEGEKEDSRAAILSPDQFCDLYVFVAAMGDPDLKLTNPEPLYIPLGGVSMVEAGSQAVSLPDEDSDDVATVGC